jgi:zinc D-Ala-D-Ala carboxypeptidase
MTCPGASKKHRGLRLLPVLAVLLPLLGLACSSPQDHGRVQAAMRLSLASEASPRPTEVDAGGSPALEEANFALKARARVQAATAAARAHRSCDDLGVLVDRAHDLPPGYVPEDLVPLPERGVPTLGGRDLLLREEAAEQLRRLVWGAAADGEELLVASAYRSYEDQEASHARLASIYGKAANAMSATPGHSQHQLGTAVDFTNAAAGYEVWLPFGETSAYVWLLRHAGEYGFVLAYPGGSEAETGYEWEPWHFRYVGPENAALVAEGGGGLQGFLEREGVVPRC